MCELKNLGRTIDLYNMIGLKNQSDWVTYDLKQMFERKSQGLDEEI